jgi:hypothetical protein
MENKTVHIIARVKDSSLISDPVVYCAVTTLGPSYANKLRGEYAEEEFDAMIEDGADNQEELGPEEFLAECGVKYVVYEAPLCDSGF